MLICGSAALRFQEEIFEMTDIDAGSRLLPITEEVSMTCEPATHVTQHDYDLSNLHHAGSTVAIDSGRQQQELHSPATSVRSAYFDSVQQELRQIRDSSTPSQPAVFKQENHI